MLVRIGQRGAGVQVVVRIGVAQAFGRLECPQREREGQRSKVPQQSPVMVPTLRTGNDGGEDHTTAAFTVRALTATVTFAPLAMLATLSPCRWTVAAAKASMEVVAAGAVAFATSVQFTSFIPLVPVAM